MTSLRIGRSAKGEIKHVGTIAGIDSPNPEFSYDASYLEDPDASAISFSLPLRESPYCEQEFRPYFQGLLPEGAALERLAAEQRLRVDDYLGILARCGLDCIGDIVLDGGASMEHAAYRPVDMQDVLTKENDGATPERLQAQSRLSIAGTQSKIGLFHDDGLPMDEGWYQPLGGAPSNYILKYANADLPDLTLVEAIVMMSARECGISTPDFSLVGEGFPAMCSKRFDRIMGTGISLPVVEDPRHTSETIEAPIRLHQEDFTQAFGLLPGSKYAELEPSTARAIADFMQSRFLAPAADRMAFARLACFNYLVGNCDNHLKNVSIAYGANGGGARLAPPYDLVSTTHFQRFTRQMGMRIGDAIDIDEVTPSDLRILASDLGVALPLMRTIAATLADKIDAALRTAGTSLESQGHAAAPYLADEIDEELQSRKRILLDL